MARDLHQDPVQQTGHDTQAAAGGPNPFAHAGYADWALKLLDTGYEPLPLIAGQKRPAVKDWTAVTIDAAQVLRWCREHPKAGIGLRTGHLVGIDLDITDPDLAHQMAEVVEARLGPAPMRVGLWPKRLYLARTERPFARLSIRNLEVLCQGQQLVAFGIHPRTGQPYYWTDDTPLDVPLSDLPVVDEAWCRDLLSELAALLPAIGEPQKQGHKGGVNAGTGTLCREDGLVVDGRDGWLSTITYHSVQDALDAGRTLQAEELAETAWARFAATTDLSRGKKDGVIPYGPTDALAKICDKLAFLAAGRLPAREPLDATPVDVTDGLPVAEARERLATVIAAFCQSTENWGASGRTEQGPRIGIRASVGLGKSAVSRRELLVLVRRLREAGLPHRILVFVPSLALADEAALGWIEDGLNVAVHRGYEAKLPGSGEPMCRDLDMVRMATSAGLSVFPNACLRRGGASCHNFECCPKQANLRGIERADVVLAAYDSLFSGLAVNADKVAMMVIDEGCWERADRRTRIGLAEITAPEAVDEPRMEDPEAEERAWADLYRFRAMAAAALQANGTGPLSRQHLADAGLSVSNCAQAAALEIALRVDPGLRPGLPQGARRHAQELSQDANRSLRREALFRALEACLHSAEAVEGRVTVLPPEPGAGSILVEVRGIHRIDAGLAHLPVLHLDATLRRGLVETLLPGLEVTDIAAAMPHMHLTLVQGGFAKSSLVEDPRAHPDENRRRRNRLQDVVDHVRWEAARVAPGRILVVTYQAIEPAFAGIAGVSTGHFKAIAGLDVFKNVALLIVVGRPLPGSEDIARMTSAHLGHLPAGNYYKVRRGLLMRDGSRRAVTVIEHEDPTAEILRAAICDDEVIQAIGRGRGVNRTVDNPLEVQILADVALPLVHDRVVAWEFLVPDLMQRMLLGGVAVDSPADATALHPLLFETVVAAEHAFRRAGFNRQNPIGTSYREMAVKSARYRRGGRGRSWQRVWWISGDAEDVRRHLETWLGRIAEWIPGANQHPNVAPCRFKSEFAILRNALTV